MVVLILMNMMVMIFKMETVWAWHVTWGRVRDQKGRKLQRNEPPPYKGAPDPFVQFFQQRVFIHSFISFALSAKFHDFRLHHYISLLHTFLTILRTTLLSDILFVDIRPPNSVPASGSKSYSVGLRDVHVPGEL